MDGVQERGLYFPNVWSSEYTPILSMSDAGESAKKGSLLVATYGEGYYIYTGLSFLENCPLVLRVPTSSLAIFCLLEEKISKKETKSNNNRCLRRRSSGKDLHPGIDL